MTSNNINQFNNIQLHREFVLIATRIHTQYTTETTQDAYFKIGMIAPNIEGFDELFQQFDYANHRRIALLVIDNIIEEDPSGEFLTEDDDEGYAHMFYNYWITHVTFFDMESRTALNKEAVIRQILEIRQSLRRRTVFFDPMDDYSDNQPEPIFDFDHLEHIDYINESIHRLG
jgi:hypothetical protein